MKKTYINPTQKVVNLKMRATLLAGSELTIGAAGSANDAEGRYFDFEDEEY